MTQEQLRMQMLAGIITESQYKNMLNENKLEMVGSDVDELLDVINFINGGPVKSPFRDVARLKPLDTTGHQIADNKFSIEVELVPSGKVGEKLPNEGEYIQQINSFLEEKGYQSKLTNFTVIEKSISTRGFGGKVATGKEQEKVIGYYTSFSNALNKISKEKFYQNQGEYSSIKEYINTWDKVKTGMETLLKSIEI